MSDSAGIRSGCDRFDGGVCNHPLCDLYLESAKCCTVIVGSNPGDKQYSYGPRLPEGMADFFTEEYGKGTLVPSTPYEDGSIFLLLEETGGFVQGWFRWLSEESPSE